MLAGDWITQLSPVIGTMSATCSVWWYSVRPTAFTPGGLQPTPFRGLALRQRPRFPACADRAKAHGAARAVPAEIRAELVAVRAMSSLAVVVAVLCRYQPGVGLMNGLMSWPSWLHWSAPIVSIMASQLPGGG